MSVLKKMCHSFKFLSREREIGATAAMTGMLTKQVKLLLYFVTGEQIGLFFLAIFIGKQPGLAFYYIAAAILFLGFSRFIDGWNFYLFYWLTFIQIFVQASMLHAFYGDTFSVEFYFFLMIPVASYALLLPSRVSGRKNLFISAAAVFCTLAIIYFALLPYVYPIPSKLSFTTFAVFNVYYIAAAFGLMALETYFFAKQMVITLQNAQELASQLSHRANFDALTGLYNRYEINRFLTDAFTAYVKRGIPLSACMADIDNFKQINDTYGHTAGDYVLRGVAQIMNNNIRKYSDYLGRWGGEEFLLVMATSQSVCFRRAEALRQLIEKNVFEFEGVRIAVTLTFGVAAANESTQTPEALVELADKMLYKGKRAGRNCTIAAPAPDEVDSSKEQQA